MSTKKIILWDFDGTLAHRPGMWSQALFDVLLERQPSTSVTIEDIRPFMRNGFPWHRPREAHPHLATAEDWWAEIEQLFARAYVGVGCSAREAALLAPLAHQRYLDIQGWLLFEDTLPALDALTQQGWEHAILSNHVPELPLIVAALGLSPYVQAVFTSGCIGYEKPHPQAFRYALDQLGSPTIVWMVGDNIEADILGAQAAGIPAILVRKQDDQASQYCETLTELPALFTNHTA
ncbi:MAG: HAD family hydrolase [Ktedonobacteraceae bacterium]